MHDSSKERDNLARNGFVYLKKKAFLWNCKKKVEMDRCPCAQKSE